MDWKRASTPVTNVLVASATGPSETPLAFCLEVSTRLPNLDATFPTKSSDVVSSASSNVACAAWANTIIPGIMIRNVAG